MSRLARADHETLRLRFHHGLGDTLMFRSVLQALNRPTELFLGPNLGQDTIFHGDLCVRVTLAPERPEAYRCVEFPMERSIPCKSGFPTKARICLEHEFGLVLPTFEIRPLPLPDLSSLELGSIRATREFLNGLGDYALCHFQGSWAPHVQNPSYDFARRTVDFLQRAGLGVVVVNYDYAYHNPVNCDFNFIDGDRVRSTYRRLPMAFESLWVLLQRASLFIGVVSGPLHAAACTGKPTICLRKASNFATDFYDAGIDHVAIVDVDLHSQVPPRLLREMLGGGSL